MTTYEVIYKTVRELNDAINYKLDNPHEAILSYTFNMELPYNSQIKRIVDEEFLERGYKLNWEFIRSNDNEYPDDNTKHIVGATITITDPRKPICMNIKDAEKKLGCKIIC